MFFTSGVKELSAIDACNLRIEGGIINRWSPGMKHFILSSIRSLWSFDLECTENDISHL
jgi:hypothetical protein